MINGDGDDDDDVTIVHTDFPQKSWSDHSNVLFASLFLNLLCETARW